MVAGSEHRAGTRRYIDPAFYLRPFEATEGRPQRSAFALNAAPASYPAMVEWARRVIADRFVIDLEGDKPSGLFPEDAMSWSFALNTKFNTFCS